MAEEITTNCGKLPEEKLKTLREIHNNTNNQDRELFLKQLQHFREVMCSTNFKIQEKLNEFRFLSEAYFRCNLIQQDIDFFVLTKKEFDRRLIYELQRKT